MQNNCVTDSLQLSMSLEVAKEERILFAGKRFRKKGKKPLIFRQFLHLYKINGLKHWDIVIVKFNEFRFTQGTRVLNGEFKDNVFYWQSSKFSLKTGKFFTCNGYFYFDDVKQFLRKLEEQRFISFTDYKILINSIGEGGTPVK